MAAESNSSSSGFHPQLLTSSSSSPSLNGLAINFQSGAISSSTSEMIPMGLGGGFFGGRMNANMGLSSGCLSGLVGSGSGLVPGSSSGSAGSLLLDSVPGLKHDAGVAVEWTAEEQYKLEEGLERFLAEPTIMKYVKIAATLRDKTVRDVALRCRWWMSRKRRKPDEQNAGKKVNNRKDKLVQSSSKINVSSTIPMNMSAFSLMTGQMGQNKHMFFNGLSDTAKNLLEQNAQDFTQISTNLSTFKLQENIDLFCRTRNNITAILNDMNETPGIMSQMPPLPVSIDEDLIHSFLHNGTQGLY